MRKKENAIPTNGYNDRIYVVENDLRKNIIYKMGTIQVFSLKKFCFNYEKLTKVASSLEMYNRK